MKFNYNNDVLTLFFIGEVNSSNAPTIQTEVEEIIKDKNIIDLVLDFEELNYISSAGLRIILTLSKTFKNHIRIINTNLEVNNILHMTGFSEFIPTTKALRKISINGCKLIAEGAIGSIYRLDNDTIVKVFKYDLSMEDIEREIKTAKKAFVYGVPTAISYDIVRVNDKYGLVFELISCGTLCEHIIKEPENFDKYSKLYANIFKTIHDIEAADSNLPSAKYLELDRLERIKDYISIEHYKKLKKMINDIPESNHLVHGDCHIKNIMIQNDEPIIIDMDTVCLGDKIFDLFGLYLSTYSYQEYALKHGQDNNKEFFGVDCDKIAYLFDELVKISYPGKYESHKQEIYDKICIGGSINYMLNVIQFLDCNKERIEDTNKHFEELLQKYDSFEI